MIVVSNSTILIGLARIGKLDILNQLFGTIKLPQEVFRELVEKGEGKTGADAVKDADWIDVSAVEDQREVALLLTTLEKGEAETLVLAKECHADLMLVDEEKARKSAVLAGFEVMGLLGLLLLAKKRGFLSEIRPCIEELQQKQFRISAKIIKRVLTEAGEKV
ncbi:MAG: DUF3368 domain-containing protein [Candidatus Vecturithrix sp.]|jgi:predicted nucleic acid-binding protein|nr:DUF3368 domain-containing protein [Candidatus Vecturithrix sp.]